MHTPSKHYLPFGTRNHGFRVALVAEMQKTVVIEVSLLARVKLRLMGPFWFSTGVKELEMEGATVNEVISKFVRKFKDKIPKSLVIDASYQLHPLTLVLLNGSDVEFIQSKRDAKLRDGDIVAIAPPVSGG